MKLLSKRGALHARAELMIPWLVNKSLPADAESALQEHIGECPECRQDYEEQLRVREAMRAEGPLVFAAEPSYQKLLTRIRTAAVMEDWEEPQNAEGARSTLGRAERRPGLRWASPLVQGLAAAVVLQAFTIGLGAWAWHSHEVAAGARYLTLTSPSPSYQSAARVRVVFKPDLSLGSLQHVLQGVGARIIDGPADGDVYTLGFARPSDSAAGLDQRVAALRANPAVLFAEPIEGGER